MQRWVAANLGNHLALRHFTGERQNTRREIDGHVGLSHEGHVRRMSFICCLPFAAPSSTEEAGESPERQHDKRDQRKAQPPQGGLNLTGDLEPFRHRGRVRGLQRGYSVPKPVLAPSEGRFG